MQENTEIIIDDSKKRSRCGNEYNNVCKKRSKKCNDPRNMNHQSTINPYMEQSLPDSALCNLVDCGIIGFETNSTSINGTSINGIIGQL